MKISNLKNKLIFCAVYVGVIALWMALDLQCFWLGTFGVPCPGCGMTRAWLAALQLDFSAAFTWHPMFWCVPIGVVFILCDGKVFSNNKVNALILGALAVGIFSVYLARLLGFLGGFSLI